MALAIGKISGVVSFTQDTNQPRFYFGSKGKYSVANDNVTIYIEINGDSYQFAYTDLRVNGQTPSTINTARTLLNSILGI